MAYDLQEQEQLAELKAWWATYGKPLVAIAMIAVLGFAGWRGYQIWQDRRAGAASDLYGQAQKAYEAKDAAKFKEAAGTLAAQYPKTMYAAMSALLAAKHYTEAGDLKSAEAQLQWVLDRSDSEEGRALARLRLAGLMLDQKRFDEGLKLLGGPAPAAFDALYADRRGDIYAAQNKPAEARKEYKAALEKISPQAGALRNLVQVKLDTLGEG